jgi:translation initiation factor 2B subunit (eIF-2B alpha/beta/delta family)
MDFLPVDMAEELKKQFVEEMDEIVNELAVRLAKTSQNTLKFTEIQEVSLGNFCNDIEKGISANEEFAMHCEVLSAELTGIETLAEKIRAMRRHCEELEKRVIKYKSSN